MTSQGSERNVHQCLQISPRPYSKSPLRGEASNRLVLCWLKAVVVSDEVKGVRDGVRWGPGRRAQANRC